MARTLISSALGSFGPLSAASIRELSVQGCRALEYPGPEAWKPLLWLVRSDCEPVLRYWKQTQGRFIVCDLCVSAQASHHHSKPSARWHKRGATRDAQMLDRTSACCLSSGRRRELEWFGGCIWGCGCCATSWFTRYGFHNCLMKPNVFVPNFIVYNFTG